jgi:hypothetical protein
MKAFEAVKLFEEQLARGTGLKVVLMPNALKEPGIHIKLSCRKVLKEKLGARPTGEREIRLYVYVDGSVISETGLGLALDACESLASYLAGCSRLEGALGAPIANTRVVSTTNEGDGILQDPDKDEVAWLDDLYFVSIMIPA